jgi:transcription elongation factor B subunit 1
MSFLFSSLFPGSFAESKEGSATFPEISTEVLEKIIQYFHYKQRWTNSREPVPEFPVNPEEALNLLMAANFLDC